MTPLHDLSISELAPRLAAREVSSLEVTEACLSRIAADNPRFNAFITVLGDQARQDARRADAEIAAGRYRGPLHGVPISLKDLIDLAGVPTTAASRVLDGHVARADAVVAARLREAGAVFLGKCNLHEFAFGTTSEDSAFGPVRNPRDVDAVGRRIERRLGRGRRQRHGAGLDRHRHGRLDPHPGRRVRVRRPQADERRAADATGSFP